MVTLNYPARVLSEYWRHRESDLAAVHHFGDNEAMPIVDDEAHELNVKIAYFGPGLAGKTSNLQYLYNRANPKTRGKMISIATETERTLSFDFLPTGFAPIRGYGFRVHLYTVPGPVFYDSSRIKILNGVSGVIFVADSQRERLEANIESLENLHSNLEVHGRRIEDTPIVFQYNKRDLPNAMQVDELDRVLTPRRSRFPAIAPKGNGVTETFEACAGEIHAEASRWIETNVYR